MNYMNYINYKYKFEKYNTKVNTLLGGFLFNDQIKKKINDQINVIIQNKKLMTDTNPSLQEIIFNDCNVIEFKTQTTIKYFLIDSYGNLISYKNSKKEKEIIKKIMDYDKIITEKKIPNLEDLEFNKIIENQIYLGLLYSDQKLIELFDLNLLDTLHVFTRTIVELVLNKIKSL